MTKKSFFSNRWDSDKIGGKEMLDSKKLAEARKKNKLSQTRAAYKLNTTRQCISGWERGEHEPDTDKLHEMAKLYGVSVADFFADENDIPNGNVVSPEPMPADSGEGADKKSKRQKNFRKINLKKKLKITIAICAVLILIIVALVILFFTHREDQNETVSLEDMVFQIIDLETVPDGRFEFDL